MGTYQSDFGIFLKTKRAEKTLTLREVCKKTGMDPSNWSKIERGVMAPPSDIAMMTKIASVLGLDDGTPELDEFISLSQITRGEIPREILESEELVPLLPAFFRTIKGKKPTNEEILKLIELLKNY